MHRVALEDRQKQSVRKLQMVNVQANSIVPQILSSNSNDPSTRLIWRRLAVDLDAQWFARYFGKLPINLPIQHKGHVALDLLPQLELLRVAPVPRWRPNNDQHVFIGIGIVEHEI